MEPLLRWVRVGSGGCNYCALGFIGSFHMVVESNSNITCGSLFGAALGMTRNLLFSYCAPCVGALPDYASCGESCRSYPVPSANQSKLFPPSIPQIYFGTLALWFWGLSILGVSPRAWDCVNLIISRWWGLWPVFCQACLFCLWSNGGKGIFLGYTLFDKLSNIWLHLFEGGG